MTIEELLPTLHELSRADKLRAMQFLVQELAQEEEVVLNPNATYAMWTPYNAFEAADTLLKILQAEENE